MKTSTIPTIQDVMDKARLYSEQGLDQDKAIKRAIASIMLTTWPEGLKTPANVSLN